MKFQSPNITDAHMFRLIEFIPNFTMPLLRKWVFYLISFWLLTEKDRKTMFIALLVTSVLGTLSFLFLKKSSSEQEDDILTEEESQALLSPRLMYSKSNFKHFSISFY